MVKPRSLGEQPAVRIPWAIPVGRCAEYREVHHTRPWSLAHDRVASNHVSVLHRCRDQRRHGDSSGCKLRPINVPSPLFAEEAAIVAEAAVALAGAAAHPVTRNLIAQMSRREIGGDYAAQAITEYFVGRPRAPERARKDEPGPP